jgi:putrescine transport system substrate-binding protein
MKLTRRTALTALGGALAAPYIQPAWAAGRTVNIYNWSEYIGETTLADFEAATGITPVYDLYASAEEMQAKMLAGSTGYDVVLQSGMSLPRLVQAGVYQKLDMSKLPNWANLDPEILKIIEGFDPGHLYAVPYMWGSVGITYNMDEVRKLLPDADLNDLGVLLNPETASVLAQCGISILDSPTDIGYMVMRYLGIDTDTAGPAEYARMVEAFKPMREYIAAFDNSNYLSGLPNGDVCVANSWSGDYSVALARAKEAGIDINLKYFVPKTGAPAWFDVWAIPADAKNVAEAHEFMNFMMQPDIIAAATNYTGYANANKAAFPLVDPAISSNPAIYPDAETMSRLYTPATPTPEQNSEINRAWTEVKAG